MKRAIDRLRDAIREERYLISVHANEEMSNDELMAIDIENAILNGKIAKRFTKDPRGARYEVVGKACDGRPIVVVCRTLGTEWLRIITVFALENDDHEK